MQFAGTATPPAISMVTYTQLLIADPTTNPSPLTTTQSVKDAVNASYDGLFTLATQIDSGWGLAQAYDDVVANQIEYSQPTGFIGLEYVEVDTAGNNLSTTVPSSASIQVYEVTTMQEAWKEYVKEKLSTTKFYAYVRGNKIGIVPAEATTGTNTIRFTYRASPTALSSDGDIPVLPAAYHELICIRAAIALRASFDLPTDQLQALETARMQEFLQGFTALSDVGLLVRGEQT